MSSIFDIHGDESETTALIAYEKWFDEHGRDLPATIDVWAAAYAKGRRDGLEEAIREVEKLSEYAEHIRILLDQDAPKGGK